MKILMCAPSATDPSSRFRMLQFVEPLRRLKHTVEFRPADPSHFWKSSVPRSQKLPFWVSVYAASLRRIWNALPVIRQARDADVVFMNRPLTPDPWLRLLEPLLLRANPRLVFDFDDAIHEVGSQEPKISGVIRASAWVTPGNEYLAAYARLHNPNVTILPTVVDTDIYQPARKRYPGPIRIGWSGSSLSMGLALPILKPILRALTGRETFEFIVISDQHPGGDWSSIPLRYVRWTPETEIAGLQQIDIGLMPLNDTPFERGKCGLKLTQYMGVGVATLASPVGVNTCITLPGETGFLASDPVEWLDALQVLLRDEKLRRQMGENGRQRAEQFYSLRAALPQLVGVFRRVVG